MAGFITVNIKFYAGTEKFTGLNDYDPVKGVDVTTKAGTRLWTVLRRMRYQRQANHSFFRDGNRIHRLTKLMDGDQIFCLAATGGG